MSLWIAARKLLFAAFNYAIRRTKSCAGTYVQNLVIQAWSVVRLRLYPCHQNVHLQFMSLYITPVGCTGFQLQLYYHVPHPWKANEIKRSSYAIYLWAETVNNTTRATKEMIPHAMKKRESIGERAQPGNKAFRNERVNEVS